jgi:hypothetical protein
MIIIPLGIDCGIASYLKEKNLRNISLPFDWSVPYNGIAKIFKNDFKELLPEYGIINKNYEINFVHNTFPRDTEQMTRRINRLLDLLNSQEELLFIRRGHAIHHHDESKKFNFTLKNDLDDMIELNELIQTKYPNLKYKIHVVLVCGICFKQEKYEDINNIIIHNISSMKLDDNEFYKIMDNIIKDNI